MSWRDQLQPASFRDIPFAVIAAGGKFGRRNAIHEYPFRDTVWVEDLGRSARRFNLSGFLIEDSLVYGGGDVIGQTERMIAASEMAGDGILIHPTRGRLTVSLLDFNTAERVDLGRVVQIDFAFIEAGLRVFPAVGTATGDAVTAAAAEMDTAASGDFGTRALLALRQTSAAVTQAVSTTGAWALSAQRLARDATGLVNMVQSLPGSFGRYHGRAGGSFFSGGSSPILSGLTSVQALISQGAQARGVVTASAANLNVLAGKLGLL